MKMSRVSISRQFRRKLVLICAVALPGSTLVGCAGPVDPLPVVDSVDLQRYAGKWYEIARYPNNFEEGCAGVTAEYTPMPNGRISVLNTCIEGSLDGEARVISGSARAVDETNARLKVTFFWPFSGDYWIIELGEEYDYALVGEPQRELMWILSRTPQLDQAIFDGILERLPDYGYDPDRLIMVPQPEEEAAG